MKWISTSASLSAGFPCSLRRILISIFMASLREGPDPKVGPGVNRLCDCECEICRRGTDPGPEPVLQRVEANEHGIHRREEVSSFAIAGPLPIQLCPVHKNQPARIGSAGGGHWDLIAAIPHTSASGAECSVIVAGASSVAGAFVMNA